MPSRDSVIKIVVIRYMSRRHNSVICFKISSISQTCGLYRWLSKVNLSTNQMYIFSNNSLFGN